MPDGTVDASVDGEWSFAQTLRHLVMATDTWLGKAVLEREAPYHPLGLPNAEYATDGYDTSVFTTREPSYAEVLEARDDRSRWCATTSRPSRRRCWPSRGPRRGTPTTG